MTDDPDRESYYQAAADVWERGCRGETLREEDETRFRQLARDRFYTFMLSINHSRVEGNAEKVQSLIRSLAMDLSGAPGLKQAWYDNEFSSSEFGELVTALLETGSFD